MKQVLNFAVIFICITAFPKDNCTATISGTIANHTVHSISIDNHPLTVAENGSFNFETAVSKARILTLIVLKQPVRIHVAPGNYVTLSFDEQNPYKTLKFSGDSAAINRYLLMEDGINFKLAPFLRIGQGNWVKLFSLDETAFLKKLDRFRQRYQQALKIAKVTDLQFLLDTRNSIKLSFDWLILQYPHFHSRYTGTPTTLSSKTKAYLNAINVDDPALLDNESYVRFTKDWLYPRIRETFWKNAGKLKTSDNQWLVASLDVVSDTFTHPDNRIFWQYFFLKDHIDRNGVKHLQPFIDNFNKTAGNQKLKDELSTLYKKEKAGLENHPVKTYKTINGFKLDAHIFMPKVLKQGETRPALVFFHGGSWSEGKPDWQFGLSPYGLVKICIEYRTYERYRALPTDAISDAKSAIRWVRQHASELHVNPNRIIAAGNSAGGHLALCTAMVKGMDEPKEDLSVSSRPNALILTSAVYALGSGVWFADKLKNPQLLKAISPLNLVRSGLPPMLVFHGTADVESAPYPDCLQFVKKMKAVGNTVDFHSIKGKGHFLWRYGAYWQQAGPATAAFLKKLGYLNKPE